MDWRKALKKTWHFLWHEDSILSWTVNIVLAFILIKFVLYPAAGFLLGSELPVVAVVSSSMDHRTLDGTICGERPAADATWWQTCGDWYTQRNITQEAFEDYPFDNGFWKGDIMILGGADDADVGDVIVFTAGRQYPIIHRVVEKWEEDGTTYYATKGDHNEEQISEYGIYSRGRWYLCEQTIGEGVYPAECGPGARRVTADSPRAQRLLDETRIPEDIVIGKAIARLPLVGWVKIGFVELLDAVGIGVVAKAF